MRLRTSVFAHALVRCLSMHEQVMAHLKICLASRDSHGDRHGESTDMDSVDMVKQLQMHRVTTNLSILAPPRTPSLCEQSGC